MKVFAGLAELEQALGTHLGYSGWHTTTQQQVDTFAEATGDHRCIGVDPGRSAVGPFSATAAHGFLTFSLVSTLAWQVYRVEWLRMTVNYGASKVRFPALVPVGSRVRVDVDPRSLINGSAGHQLVAKVTIEREGLENPAGVVETVSVLVS